jgi:hypothetical protein
MQLLIATSAKMTIQLQDSLRLGDYDLGQINRAEIYGPWFSVLTNDTATGKLLITQITPYSVSGSFWFNPIDAKGSMRFQITQGNFDIAR